MPFREIFFFKLSIGINVCFLQFEKVGEIKMINNFNLIDAERLKRTTYTFEMIRIANIRFVL